MKKLVFIFSAVMIIMTVCKKEEMMNGGCHNLFYGVSFTVQDRDGNDLLDPDVSGHIETFGTKVDYIDQDGKKIGNPTIFDYSKRYGTHDGYFIEGSILGIGFGEIYRNSNTTVVRWVDGTVDTIKCNYGKDGECFILSEIVINDGAVWRLDDIKDPYLRQFACFKILIDGDQKTFSLLEPDDLSDGYKELYQ